MYAWKCWRDTRVRFFVYLIFAVLIAVSSAVIASMRYEWPGGRPQPGSRLRYVRPTLKFRRGGDQGHIVDVWSNTANVGLGGSCALLIALAGFGIGASGAGEDFEQHTLDFLLTRPRRRRYFVWAGWAAGILDLLLIVALSVLAAFLTLIYATKTLLAWKFWAIVLPLFILAAATHSLTYFLSVLTRSTRTGLSLAVGIVLADTLVPPFLRLFWTAHLPWVLWWQLLIRSPWTTHLPSLVDLFSGGNWTLDPTAHFPFVAAVGWSLFAVALVFATELIFERAEV